MGKKSKRTRGRASGGGNTNTSNTSSSHKKKRNVADTATATTTTTVVETMDNLRFQDPFVDTLEEEKEVQVEGQDDDDDQRNNDDGASLKQAAPWNSTLSQQQQQHGSNLQDYLEESGAYKMHHALTVEWPSLSFDFLRDDLGESRTRFPHSCMAVAGTQAAAPASAASSSSSSSTFTTNKLQLLKLSDLDKIKVENDEDVLGDEYDKQDDDSDSDDSDDDSSVDLDPILEAFDYKHEGGVNRVRCMPHSTICATWSDVGKVFLYDVQPLVNQCSSSNNSFAATPAAALSQQQQPFFTYKGHSNEGFAMDWSNSNSNDNGNSSTNNLLATGDVDGNIHIWQGVAAEGRLKDIGVTPMYESEHAVEDLQWSPMESTVLAAAECDGYIKIYDTRAPHKSMLSHCITQNGVDVNVMSWNKLVANLLCTGDDDGVVSVWDLRNFSQKKNAPLARFTSHTKTPITSVEWHPTDESMLAVTDNVGTYIYDLSVEEEYATEHEQQEHEQQHGADAIPPQLLFVHCGSEQYKEVHWHPQITSCLMTTALSGFSVFIPSNL